MKRIQEMNTLQDKIETMVSPLTDVVSGPVLEIELNGFWLVAEQDVWDAWTGLRKRNGEDFHGDVHPITAPTQVWTGSRVCPCRVCQAHVEAKYRPN